MPVERRVYLGWWPLAILGSPPQSRAAAVLASRVQCTRKISGVRRSRDRPARARTEICPGCAAPDRFRVGARPTRGSSPPLRRGRRAMFGRIPGPTNRLPMTDQARSTGDRFLSREADCPEPEKHRPGGCLTWRNRASTQRNLPVVTRPRRCVRASRARLLDWSQRRRALAQFARIAGSK